MTSDLTDVLGDSLPFELGGKEYRFAKIDLGMMADFETTLSLRQLQRSLKALGENASHEERARVIQSFRISATDLSAGVYSAEGVRLLLYLSLKRNHPEITEEEVGRLVTIQALPELRALIDKLSDADAMNDAAELSKNAETAAA